MTTASTNNAGYAKGWSVNRFNNWWHTGALDGTASIMVRANQGYAWAVILNKRIIDNRANAFWSALDALPWDCVSNTISWPAHDLFDVPSENPALLSFGNGTSSSFNLNWQGGNGDKCIVLAREGSTVDAFPLDGMSYNADATFGNGDEIGSGNFVVYAGNGTSVNVQGLDQNKTYHFRLFEYNENANTGNYALYQLCDYLSGEQKPSSTVGFLSLEEQGIRCYPNPARAVYTIELPEARLCDNIRFVDMLGKTIKTVEISEKRQSLTLETLPRRSIQLSLKKKELYLE
jgi:hypothetical protein